MSALLSDGTLTRISSQSAVSSLAPSVVGVSSLGSAWLLAPSVAGTAQVSVSFETHSSQASVTVTDAWSSLNTHPMSNVSMSKR